MKIHCLPTLFCLALAGHVFGQKVIPNHAIADLVLGQSDFVTGTSQPVTSSFSLSDARCVAVDPMTQKVFVSDGGSGRVLRFASANSLINGAGAEAVFGKASFGDTASGDGTQGMSSIRGIFLDRKGRLWVADGNNNRILCFEAASFRSSQPHADRVFGQPDFLTTSPGTTSAKMNLPESVVVDSSDRLWVAEFSNNRVLRFDSISTKSNGASADGVLGQALFTTSSSGSGAAQMNSPVGVAVSSSGTLFVADSNNRVTRFPNAATLANGAAATGVLGQPDFVTNSSGTTQSKLSTPRGIFLTPVGELWVTDDNNNRILRFNNAETISSGSPASGVVGQPDFSTSTSATTNRGIDPGLSWPFVDAVGNLWIGDRENRRALRFPPDVTKPLLTLTGTVPKKTTSKSLVIKGTASDAFGVSKIQYRIGSGALKTASGTTNWQFTAALKKGKNTITIFATDSVGNVSLNKVVKVKRS
jgi:sugar lactone lactonase YvrE